MKTLIEQIDCSDINLEVLEKCARLLTNNETVAFPTETVYGLGANALNEEAVKKIFEAKGRPSDNPLIVHIDSADGLDELVTEVSEDAKILMEHFWPGPMTLIFKKKSIIPQAITGGLDTVAIRVPSHPIARKLIELSKRPIAAPSANLSGKPSPTVAKHVIEDLDGRVSAIIDGGDSEIGLESTVIDVTGDVPMILRPGAITKKMCEAHIKEVRIDPGIQAKLDNNVVPKSPGMKYKHYAPKAEVYVVNGDLDKVSKEIIRLQKEAETKGKKVGILSTEETQSAYDCEAILSLGSRKNENEMASNLFKSLRKFDELSVDLVLAEAVDDEEVGLAIMNRLNKAAGYKIIKLS